MPFMIQPLVLIYITTSVDIITSLHMSLYHNLSLPIDN